MKSSNKKKKASNAVHYTILALAFLGMIAAIVVASIAYQNTLNNQTQINTLKANAARGGMNFVNGMMFTTLGSSSSSYASVPDNNNQFNSYAFGKYSIPLSGTFSNMYVETNGAQPASGSLTCTLFLNGVATSLSVVIPASAPTGVYSDLTDSVSVGTADLVAYHCVNAATATSTELVYISSLFR